MQLMISNWQLTTDNWAAGQDSEEHRELRSHSSASRPTRHRVHPKLCGFTQTPP